MELKFTKFGKDYFFVGAFNETITEDVVNGAVKALALHLGVAETSVPYLMQYGYSQSMQDCIAGTAKAVAVELTAEAKKKGTGLLDAELTAATESTIDGLLSKRWDALIAGDVGIRTVSERDPVLTLAREEVWIALRRPENADKAKAIRALDKEARNAKITELSNAHKAKHGERLAAEVARRKANEIAVEL